MIDGVTKTNGEFTDEVQAMSAFDDIANRSGAFVKGGVWREVWGEIHQPRYGCDQRRVRIDRILQPGPMLREAGWRDGLIGVEGKASGKKLGRVVCQSMDYARSIFRLPESGTLVALTWVFVFPLDGEPKGDVGSIMAQHRIGWCRIEGGCRLVFGSGATRHVIVDVNGSCSVKPFPMGKKAGNRG